MLHTTDPHNSVRLSSGHQFNMEVEQAPATESVDATVCVKMEEGEEMYLSGDSIFGATMLDGSVVPWSDDNGMRNSDNPGYSRHMTIHSGVTYSIACSRGRTTPLSPVTVNVLKSSPSPGASDRQAETTPGVEPNSGSIIDSTAGQTPITEFPMSTEDEQFDTSFDAMMNSIDITTFLPGTFSTAEDQLVVDSNPPKLSSPPGLDPIDEESFDFPQLITYSNCSECVKDVCGMPHNRTSRPSSASSSSFSATSSATHSVYAVSPLTDLDALDKSSLFMIKPEWPIVA
ncbi:unnamed protein product [Echinostoma caproni]|uniref:PHR domain-containing protein n=1 Tax=Echinostoma caproni TaxID=27848 RepID=A0A183AEN6_9TREM|nr:unnamed protein product [Echinostoma caproni]